MNIATRLEKSRLHRRRSTGRLEHRPLGIGSNVEDRADAPRAISRRAGGDVKEAVEHVFSDEPGFALYGGSDLGCPSGGCSTRFRARKPASRRGEVQKASLRRQRARP